MTKQLQYDHFKAYQEKHPAVTRDDSIETAMVKGSSTRTSRII